MAWKYCAAPGHAFTGGAHLQGDKLLRLHKQSEASSSSSAVFRVFEGLNLVYSFNYILSNQIVVRVSENADEEPTRFLRRPEVH